jgi:phosphoribosylamine--glycine ligase
MKVMERIGVLVVSYGAREASIVDALHRSLEYKVDIYVTDKQRNPFNLKRAAEHVVIPDLDIHKICRFVARRRGKIDFGIVGPEKPIINGIRDIIEGETEVPMICPTKQCAIEGSKVAQRLLFEKAVPNANPRYKVFNPEELGSQHSIKRTVFEWLDELNSQAVVKPDVPAAGKGVGVWGDHFQSRDELFEHFLANYEYGSVIIEEKLEGEESSFQALCDGKRLVALPETRDYKRAFEGDEGPNTGGMGSYKDCGEVLPFMTNVDREKETEIVGRIFEVMKKRSSGGDLRGVPFYVAFMHTAHGPKILENNSRPGDPEIINLLPLLKQDFVNVCYNILEGTLTKVDVDHKASVVTYKAPPSYAGYLDVFPTRVSTDELNTNIDLSRAYMLEKTLEDSIRIFPASIELRDGKSFAMTSRAVAAVGIGSSLSDARDLSLRGIRAIEGGALWHRNDIAAPDHIQKSINHIDLLRRPDK